MPLAGKERAVPPYSPLIALEDSLLVIIDAQERLMPVIEGHQ